MLAGRVVVVTGGGSGIGRDIALGLNDASATVVAVDGPLESREETGRAFVAGGRADAVVHALVDPDALVSAEVADTDEDSWDRRCEAVLRTALRCCQAAFDAFGDWGGRIVLVTPAVGLTGSAGLAPYATAIEGMRSLAKSAARQWGDRGITVNCVAPRIDGSSDVRTEVAPVIATLLADSARIVTGATLVVDGGLVMAP